MENNNIFKRMLAIQSEMETVGKNLNVGYGNNKYKAVGEADVLRAVKELEKKHGVYSYPTKREVIYRDKIKTKNSEMIMTEIETTYRFVNVDNSEDYIEVISYGDGVDTMDKAPGKAMTYADKYALMKAYKIVTGEDPDQTHSEEYIKGNQQAKPTQQAKSVNWSTELVNRLKELGINPADYATKNNLTGSDVTQETFKQHYDNLKGITKGLN